MLVWMDLEMTGLDPKKHVIIEMATVVTDDDLTVTAVGPELALFASGAELAEMGDYVTQMHTTSGLLDRVRSSTLTRADGEATTIAFLKEAGVEHGVVPLCGNSIGTDRRFLQEQMPELERYFHYRNVDVSTIKELAQRWRPQAIAHRTEKAAAHRALQDVYESIAELAYYRDTVFLPVEPRPAPTPEVPRG